MRLSHQVVTSGMDLDSERIYLPATTFMRQMITKDVQHQQNRDFAVGESSACVCVWGLQGGRGPSAHPGPFFLI